MRFNKLSIGAAMFVGVVLALSAGAAQADDRWDHRWDHRYDHGRYDHGWHHGYYAHERPVIVRERAPVIVERERPVYVERERPVYMAPPMMYSAPQQPSGLNLNFNIPLN